jgi:hypothetical protein
MKKLFTLFVILFLAAFVFVTSAAAFTEAPPDLELTSVQLIIIGLITMPLFQLLRWAGEWMAAKKWTFADLIMDIFVMLVAVILTLLWKPELIPLMPIFSGEFPEQIQMVITWFGAWISYLGAIYLTAHAFYLLLKDKLKEASLKMLPRVYTPLIE